MADSERPSDLLQPRSKRRAGGEELTRDNYEEEDDDEAGEGFNPGSWKPVDRETRERRKVRARRGPAAVDAAEPPQACEAKPADEAPAAAAAASAPAKPVNPFASISLAAPSANPFAGVSLLAKPATKEAPAPEPLQAEGTLTDQGPAAAGAGGAVAAAPAAEGATAESAATSEKEADAAPSTTAAASGPPAATTTGGFGGLAAKPFGGGIFGGTSGFGGFGSLAAASAVTSPSGTNAAPSGFAAFKPIGTGHLFGSSTEKVTLAFGTAAPAFGSGGGSGGRRGSGAGKADGEEGGGSGEEGDEAEEGEEGAGGAKVEPVFGDGTAAEKAPPAEPSITGEEGETTVFSVDGAKLFEFDSDARSWRERGQGEFKINTEPAHGSARMLMRSTGNYRLLINAKLFPQLAVQKIAGGVSFCCFNTAGAAEVPKPSASAEKAAGDASADKDAAAPAHKTSTWAVKIKSGERVEALISTIERYKGSSGGDRAQLLPV